MTRQAIARCVRTDHKPRKLLDFHQIHIFNSHFSSRLKSIYVKPTFKKKNNSKNNREGSKSMSENMESAIAGAGPSAVCPWEDAPTAVSVSVCPWDDDDPPSTAKQTARQYNIHIHSLHFVPLLTFSFHQQIEKQFGIRFGQFVIGHQRNIGSHATHVRSATEYARL